MSDDGSQRWVRSQRAAVVEIDEDILLVARDGTVRKLSGESAELAREVIAFFARPRNERELLRHLEVIAGPLGDRAAVVRQLVALLAEVGALTRERDEHAIPSGRGANVVVVVSGAIAATGAPAFVIALQRRGYTVEVVLTHAATRFVAIDALGAIVQREVKTSMWPTAPHVPVPHVALAHWAELVVFYPASATMLSRLAAGDFSELGSAIALTTRAPVVVVPSMNVDMALAVAVQRNLEELRADGFTFVSGVPSQEVAEAPAVRTTLAGAAPAPGEVAATIDALRTAGLLKRRDVDPAAPTTLWDGVYRRDAKLLPWVKDRVDDDIAAALAHHAPPPGRLLDVGCGLGQIARHAAQRGYRVVATDISEAALGVASRDAADTDIVWVRDDICASSLAGTFRVIVDRASLHVLPASRLHAWAISMHRLTSPGSILIVKAHRDGVAGATTGWSAERFVSLLSGFELVTQASAELPGLESPAPIPSILAVLRRRAGELL
ncbi:MAG: methyltransferase domain-containing protein [Kofleriaceae bacterium]|nr:methyltransferase domain-containing protein [Kofleriaceae bacterium]